MLEAKSDPGATLTWSCRSGWSGTQRCPVTNGWRVCLLHILLPVTERDKNKVTFSCNIPNEPRFTEIERKIRAHLKSEWRVWSLTCQVAPFWRPDTTTRSKRSRGPWTARTLHSSGSWSSWPQGAPRVQSWKTRKADPAGGGGRREMRQAKTITDDKKNID